MKEEWKYCKLGEMCSVLDSQRKPVAKSSRQKGLIPYYGASGIQDYVADFIFDGRFLLVGEDGAKWGENEKSAYIIEGKSWVNNHAHILKINEDVCDSFIEYFLTRSDLTPYVTGAVVPKLTQAALVNIQIPLPPLEQQQRIVLELDLLSDIIEKQKSQLKELDVLAQSIFYDMFGDPVENEKGWEIIKLSSCCIKIGSGATPRGGEESYKSNGISLIRSLNVHNNNFIYKNLAHIDNEQAKALDNVEVKQDDILMNITGASVARCCIVPNTILPARVNQHVCIIRPNDEVHFVYLSRLFTETNYQALLLNLSKSKASTREALSKNIVDNLSIPFPPLSLQQQFASKIELIEKQKESISKSIAEVQKLFDYTMDKYFALD